MFKVEKKICIFLYPADQLYLTEPILKSRTEGVTAVLDLASKLWATFENHAWADPTSWTCHNGACRIFQFGFMSAIVRGLGRWAVNFTVTNMDGSFRELEKIIASVKDEDQYYFNGKNCTSRYRGRGHSGCDYQSMLLGEVRKVDEKGSSMKLDPDIEESHERHFAAYRD
jgi:hypothetical protein